MPEPLADPPAIEPTLQPLDVALVEREGPGSLVAIAREGRLARQTRGGAMRVVLTPVDEAVLALVGHAIDRRRDLTIVYPAPAGEVSTLLAGQILVRRLAGQMLDMGAASPTRSASVGIVTSDPARAAATWEELAISAQGARETISGVFPALRAGPDGRSPTRQGAFRGSIIGPRCDGWPVDVIVVDHLSGQVWVAESGVPTVRIFADPLDPELERIAASGELIWGWNEAELALLTGGEHSSGTPFSVASERLETMAAGVRVTIHVAHHPEAERLVKRLRDDLRTLAEYAGPEPGLGVLRGIRVAWHHVNTLTSLPCRPSAFDGFAGLPPLAARATRTFEPEIAAWATSLSGDLREVAEVIASDLGDLRTYLEDADPFRSELSATISDGTDALVVVRTRTAARGLLAAMGGDPNGDRIGNSRIVAMRRLHREGTFERAFVVGTPARWDWHRIDSGLSADVHVLVLGDLDAYLGKQAIDALHGARARWAGREVRERTWRELVDCDPPHGPAPPVVSTTVEVVNAAESAPAVDPFEALQSILISVPLTIGDEGVEDVVGRELVTGGWQGAVDAVRVSTHAGVIVLPRDRLVDVRHEDKVLELRASSLRSGMFLIVDRRGSRVGLLEAVADRLQRQRPDLLTANLLIREFRTRVKRSFHASGMNVAGLYERMQGLGFDKTYQAARSYIEEDGPLAPRDFDDLRRLAEALDLGMTSLELRETFGGVQRWRVFRRITGKALVAASRGAIAASDATRIDADTGLSVADLRDLVLEAKVIDVQECPEPVSLAEIGYVTTDASETVNG